MPRVITKTVRRHSIQRDFALSTTLYRGFVGGRGSGKTWIGSFDLLCRATQVAEPRTFLAASPTGVLLQDTTFTTFKKLAEDLCLWDSVRLTPYPSVTLCNGSVVRFRTADDPERLRGPNLSGVWLDEASLMHADAYRICIASLREGGQQGWLSATFTPKGLGHWTYDTFGTNKPDTAIFHCRTRDNPYLPPDFQETLERQYAGLYAAQELDGRFCTLEGAEWPAEFFGPEIWFDAWPTHLEHRVLALDPSKGKQDRSGDYSAFVFAGLDKDWHLWIDADLSNNRPVEASGDAPSIVRDGLRFCQEWKPHAFSVETNGFQELVAQAFLRQSQRRLLPLYGICNTRPKAARIRTLGTYLAQGRLHFRTTPGGKLLVQQLRDFPLAEHDDGPDALHQALYLLDWLLTGQADGTQPATMRA